MHPSAILHDVQRLYNVSDRRNNTERPLRSRIPRVRILVVDDHEVMRLGIRNLLEAREGWTVCAEACNGQEAIEKAVQFHPDAIIMNIAMPVMNGLDAASRIGQTQPGIPVILFSLHLSDDLISHFHTDGIRGVVAKGDAARDLAEAVDVVLNGGTFFPKKKTEVRVSG